MNKSACIIPLSGGLDSTYLLYKVLTEQPESDIYVVHVSLIKDGENYYREEQHACTKIIKWFHDNFPDRIVCYDNPIIDLTGYPMGLDTDGVLLMAQKMAYKIVRIAQYTDVKLYIGLVADDGEYATFRNKYKGQGMNNRLWLCLLESMIGRCECLWWEKIDKNIQYPLYHQGIEKEDIIKLIPSRLLMNVWVCRRPTHGKPCTQCVSCRTHNQALLRGNDNNGFSTTNDD